MNYNREYYEACPSQWEDKTSDGKYVYVRYRWGHLTFSIDQEKVFGVQLSDGYHGTLSTKDMQEVASKHGIKFSI